MLRLQLDRGIALAPVSYERNNCPVSVRGSQSDRFEN
jgi:hypothetical protein